MYLNKVTLIGNLTRDPELKSLPSGNSVCSFSLATNEVYYDKDKKKQEKVEFHNCVAWGKTAENIAQYMSKGSQLLIEGKLQTRKWEKDGTTHYRTEIVADRVQFGAKRGGDSQPKRDDADEAFDNFGKEEPGGDTGDINPDDIPF